jgi:hypothetical protein
MGGACETCKQILVGNSEGKGALGRPECGLDSFELKVQLHILMNMEINLCVLKKDREFFRAQLGDYQFMNT